jgi:hypothetical protein
VRVGVEQHRDDAVGGAVRPAVGRGRPGVPRAARAAGVHPAALLLHEQEARHRLEHRHLDRLPEAGHRPLVQGGEDGGQGHDADRLVDHLGAHVLRLAAAALDGGQPRDALDDVVVGRLVRYGPAEP